MVILGNNSDMKIIDTATNTRSKVNSIASNGVGVIFRYYSSNPKNWKVLNKEEAQSICRESMSVGAVFEETANLNDFTRQKGEHHAIDAYFYARDMIGQPFTSAIYFAVDLDVPHKTDILHKIIPYFEGIKSVFECKKNQEGEVYEIGAYGCGTVINLLKDKGLCKYRWLSQSKGHNGTNKSIEEKTYELRQLYKKDSRVAGIEVDYNALHPNKGIEDIGLFQLRDSRTGCKNDNHIGVQEQPG